MGERTNITDTNRLTETCDTRFEFDIASVNFCPDISSLPLSSNIEISNESITDSPVQLNVPGPGLEPQRPLALSEFIDIFYKNDSLGSCTNIKYSLIDISNASRQLLLPTLCGSKESTDVMNNTSLWHEITLRSFGRSPWWQSVELSSAMAKAISELVCRQNSFCQCLGNVYRNKQGSMLDVLVDQNDSPGDKERIPSYKDLVEYYDAWCSVLSIAKSLGYLPERPKNLASTRDVISSTDFKQQCCENTKLFSNNSIDLQSILCENIKEIMKAHDDNGGSTQFDCRLDDVSLCNSFLVKNDEYEYTGKFCYDDHSRKYLSGLKHLIEFGLLDWCGCLANNDVDSGGSAELNDDRNKFKILSEMVAGSDDGSCPDFNYAEFPNDNHRDEMNRNLIEDNKIGFLLKLASLKFSSDCSFNNLLSMDSYTNTCDENYDYSQTLHKFFSSHTTDTRNLLNNCNYYDPCKRLKIKKNIMKSNKDLKMSVVRLCGCSLNKDELLQTVSDYIVRDSANKYSGLNNIINAKININFCRQNNGIESVVMYDANIKIDLGVYVSLASMCKDKDSVTKVLKYVFNNPNNNVLASISESFLVDLQTDYPGCYPCGFRQTQVSELGRKIYSNVLNPVTGGGTNVQNAFAPQNRIGSISAQSAFINCFRSAGVMTHDGKRDNCGC